MKAQDEQALWNAANQLAERLWEDFVRAKEERNPFIYCPILSSEEAEIVRKVYLSYVLPGFDTLGDSFTRYWKRGGLHFLAAATYARYFVESDEQFWEGLVRWVLTIPDQVKLGGDHNALLKLIRDYNALHRFFQTHKLFLLRSSGKTEYVYSLYTHVAVSNRHVPRMIEILGKLVQRYRFFLDDDLLDEVLQDFVDEAARWYQAGDSEDASDEEGDHDSGVLGLSSVASLYRWIPVSVKRACSVDPDRIREELFPLYRIAERVVLLGDTSTTHVENPGPRFWHLRNLGQSLAATLERLKPTKEEKQRTRNPRLVPFHSPFVRHDFETDCLTVVIPEQRVDSEEADEIVVTLRSDQFPEINATYSLQVFTAGDIWRLTETTELPVQRYTADLSVVLHTSERELVFPIGAQFVLLDEEGVPFRGTPSPEQDAFVLVPADRGFQSSGAQLFRDEPNRGYRLYLLHLDSETLFYVDSTAVAPCLESVPGFSVDSTHRVEGAYVTPEENHKDEIPVYRCFPAFRFRVPTNADVHRDYPLIVNGSKTPYRELRRTPVRDGRDEDLVEVYPEKLASQANLAEYVGRFGGIDKPFRLVVLENLEFAFDNPVVVGDERVRVERLSFDGDTTAFAGNYEFPMKSDSWKFRISLRGEPYRLFLSPPQLSWSLSDGAPLPPVVHIASVGHKELEVSSLGITPRILAAHSENSSEIFALKSRKISGQKMRVPLLTLQSFQTGHIKLLAAISGGASTGARSSIQITSIYVDFAFIEEPKLLHGTANSVLTSALGDGFYVTYRAIGSPRVKYTLELLDMQSSTVHAKSPEFDGEQKRDLFADGIDDGRYFFRVVAEAQRMGGRVDQELVWSSEWFDIRMGQVHATDDVANCGLACEYGLLPIASAKGKKQFVRVPIRNCYLDVKSRISPDSDYFEALGFFYNGDRKIYHSDHNPYHIRVLNREEEVLTLEIRDCQNAPVRIDRAGHVGSRDTTSVHQATRIRVRIEDFGGKDGS